MTMENLEEILEDYIKQYQTDVVIDEFKLKEIELKVPSLKGKWSAIKARNKARLVQLKRELDEYIDHNIDTLIQKSNNTGKPIQSKKGAEFILKNGKKGKEYRKLIDDLTVLVEFFESCEKNIQSMGFDIKNLVETIKLDEGG